MTEPSFPAIKDLAIIGDRRTAALIDKQGSIVWYCPNRFDGNSLFAALLDPDCGGSWQIQADGLAFAKRQYVEDSGILETTFNTSGGSFIITDWMPLLHPIIGIVRQTEAVPVDVKMHITPAPDFGQEQCSLEKWEDCVKIQDANFLYASHRLHIKDSQIFIHIPKKEKAWIALIEYEAACNTHSIEESRKITLSGWESIASHITYKGPYEEAVASSLRVLRLLTHERSGGIIAAATTSLPEVIGGERNYDYRFVWLRDSAMIVSALIRAGSQGMDERNFLEFICSTANDQGEPTIPFFTIDKKIAPAISQLPLRGYLDSRPVVQGNDANKQLQLDANGNVLLAAKQIYERFNTREHWSIVGKIADYLADNWNKPDHGIWEEHTQKQYTSSKVIAAMALEYIADFAQSPEQEDRWRKTVSAIRNFVEEKCLTSTGAYAAYPGTEAVDISAILFPIWGYTEADTPQMLATVGVLERDYCENHLFRRHLENFDSNKEGAFLAGTFWMAQYWVMRGDLERFRTIFEKALEQANDLGLFSEEVDPASGQALGNFPQTFVHASLIGAVIDYKAALEQQS